MSDSGVIDKAAAADGVDPLSADHLLESIPHGVLVYTLSNMTITRMNGVFSGLTGHHLRVGRSVDGLAELAHPDDAGKLRIALRSAVHEDVPPRIWMRDRHRRLDLRMFHVKGSPGSVALMISDPLSNGFGHDRLTGLTDRHGFHALIETCSGAGERHVVLLDLDGFWRINSAAGHAAADVVLRQSAIRLQAVADTLEVEGGKCCVARVGDDEFGLLACFAPGDVSPDITERIAAAFSTPFRVNKINLDVSASAGIAVDRVGDEDATSLVGRASVALRAAKSYTRRSYSCVEHQRGMDDGSINRLGVEADLVEAIRGGEFELFYQPKVDALSGGWVGLEALLRWNRKDGGMHSPDLFIGVLEDTGLIVPVGAWAIRQACIQMAEWHDAGLPKVPVAVNVSCRQLIDDPGSGRSLQAVVAEARANHPEALLDLELTESAIMSNPEKALAVMASCAEAGVSWAIDDFGTGHSSLAYMKRIPARSVKIDRNFIDGLPGSEEDAAIVRVVVELARTLGMTVVAEGVETEAQREVLRAAGVNQLQGYLISKPMSAGDTARWLSENPRHKA